jgi:hypothetical protein
MNGRDPSWNRRVLPAAAVYLIALVAMGSYGYVKGSPFGHLPRAVRAEEQAPLLQPRAGERFDMPPASLAVIQALRALDVPSYQVTGTLAGVDTWAALFNLDRQAPDWLSRVGVLSHIIEGAWPIRRQSRSPFKLGYVAEVQRLAGCTLLWHDDAFGIARCDD